MDLLSLAPAVNWLQQFDEADRETAGLLLRRLRCISPNVYQSEVLGLFNDVSDTLRKPIAVYVARELDDSSKYFLDKRRRPEAVLPTGEIGSEGSAVSLVTTIVRSNPQVFRNHPAIGSLKRSRCRSIVIYDDSCGTGERVGKFIEAFRRWDSLQSWLSGHLIRFYVLAFAVSTQAEKRILKAIGGDFPANQKTFFYSQRLPTGGELWSGDELGRIKSLCNRYGSLHGIRGYFRCGFGNSLSTLVFATSCPNNVPGILWNSTSSWNALFPNRAIPQSLLPAFTDNPSPDQLANVLRGLDAEAIATNKLFIEGSQAARDMLLVLAAIRSKARNEEQICIRTRLTIRRVLKALEDCKRFGLIDQNRYLTPGGREGLRIAERHDKFRQLERPNTEMYFPTSLRSRGGQDL